MNKVKEQILLWIYAWAGLLAGLVGVLTLGFWNPSWSLTSAVYLARWRYRRLDVHREMKDEN